MENGEQRNTELYEEFCKLEEQHHRLSKELGNSQKSEDIGYNSHIEINQKCKEKK